MQPNIIYNLWCSIAFIACFQFAFCQSIERTKFRLIDGRKDSLQLFIVGSRFDSVGERYGICDKNSKILIQPKYNRIEYLGHSLFAAEVRRDFPIKGPHKSSGYNYETNQFEIITLNGTKITDTLYNIVHNYHLDSSELIFVNKGYTFVFPDKGQKGLWGAINLKGEIVIPIEYAKLYALTPNLICAQQNFGSKVGYLDSKNNIIQPFEFSKVDVHNGLNSGLSIIYKDGIGYGFINKVGKIIVKPQYAHVEPFRNGNAIVYYKYDMRNFEYLSCIIDSTGKKIRDSINAVLHHAEYSYIQGRKINTTLIYNKFGELIFEVPDKLLNQSLTMGYQYFDSEGAHIQLNGKGDMEFIINHSKKRTIKNCPEGTNCNELWQFITPNK